MPVAVGPQEFEQGKRGSFTSKRFEVVIVLPGGHEWLIDDHSRPWLGATHPRTNSGLTFLLFALDTIASPDKCRAASLERFLVNERAMSTITQESTAGPGGYETRLWLALEATEPSAPVRGHFFAFGSSLRKCLFLHVVTEGAPSEIELISDRLAMFRARIFREMSLLSPLSPGRDLGHDKRKRTN